MARFRTRLQPRIVALPLPLTEPEPIPIPSVSIVSIGSIDFADRHSMSGQHQELADFRPKSRETPKRAKKRLLILLVLGSTPSGLTSLRSSGSPDSSHDASSSRARSGESVYSAFSNTSQPPIGGTRLALSCTVVTLEELSACTLYLQIEDPEVVAELQRRQEGAERDRYAVSALRLGVLALRDARGALDADTIRQEGERLLAQVSLTLNTHASDVTTAVGAGLKQYLDPTTGVLNERLDRLVKNDGDLDVLLGKHFASDTGALARTLADHVGKASPLYKLLSPEEQGGFLRSLETSVSTILDAQRQKVIDEFDLNQPESALSRLKREVTSANHQLGQDFSTNVEAVKAQFSLDDENSALSRLVAQVDAAQKKITTEFSLDDDNSALSRLRHELLGHVQHIQKIVTGLQARKEEAALSTRHGGAFEDAVCELLAEEARDLGDIGTPCGKTVGRISHCKVGDFTADLGPESSAPGKRIVVEAKAEKGYSISDALAELATGAGKPRRRSRLIRLCQIVRTSRSEAIHSIRHRRRSWCGT